MRLSEGFLRDLFHMPRETPKTKQPNLEFVWKPPREYEKIMGICRYRDKLVVATSEGIYLLEGNEVTGFVAKMVAQ